MSLAREVRYVMLCVEDDFNVITMFITDITKDYGTEGELSWYCPVCKKPIEFGDTSKKFKVRTKPIPCTNECMVMSELLYGHLTEWGNIEGIEGLDLLPNTVVKV